MAVNAGRAVRIHSVGNSGQRQGEVGVSNAQRAISLQKDAFWIQERSKRLPENYAERSGSIPVNVRAGIY